ncbi:carbohydrate porin [Croceitalea vernalis]|uniref:Carbohydrate porin n=1 Tax=Croceitalea vernalis TaxID=3075599 RepID=A0ABU3BEZ9_9FLAO|nr:carbohydrate porin [Croceitalea sp. P007]MDT0620734.1 carbohydrate porin [Croceitalea sp. P007]
MNSYGILLLAFLLFYTPLRSQETEKNKAKTIELGLSYFSESFSNLKGGAQTGTNYKGYLDFSGEFDLEKLVGFKRTSIFFNTIHVHGQSISDLIGDDLLSSNIEALAGFRMQNLYLQHQSKNEKLVLRFGKQAIDDEFLTTDISNLFVHGVAAYPFTLSNNYPQWPVAAMSVFASYQLNGLWKVRTGIYQAGPEIIDEIINSTGLDFSLTPTGYLFIAEGNYAKNNHFLRFGVMHDTNSYFSNTGEEKNGLTSLYFSLDTKLFKNPNATEKGMFLFASASTATNWSYAQFDYDLRGGISWRHFVKKQNGELGLGYFYPHLGEGAQPGAQQSLKTEQFLELTYLVTLKEWWQLQVSLQQIINPGGASLSNLPDASVLGLRTYFTL